MLAASILDAFWMTHLHYCQRTTASENWFLRPAGYDLETDRKRDKWLNGKALNRTAREADQIHYCQLPKELENRVNDFNNLHNPIFEFLVMRQGRPRPVPLGSWHQFKSCADGVIQSLESEENDEAAYR